MSNTTKLINFTCLAVLTLPFLGCQKSMHSVDEKYYLITANKQVSYWKSAFAGLNQAATQIGVKAEMAGPDNYDPKAEHEEFQRVLRSKPTGILVSAADPELLKSDIDEAISQGIPVITMDSDAPDSKRLFYIGTDNYKAGVMAAQVAVKDLNGKGTVVVYTMPDQPNLKDRLRGYRDVFANHPQIKIAQIIDIKGDPRIAFDQTMSIVRTGKLKPDAYVCLEAIACPEVADVLTRENVAGKVVVAMDTDQRTLDGIRKGTITATVGQKPFTMAFVGLKMLDDLHHHKPVPLNKDWAQDTFSPIPTFVDTGASLIDKTNVENFLQAQQSATSKE